MYSVFNRGVGPSTLFESDPLSKVSGRSLVDLRPSDPLFRGEAGEVTESTVQARNATDPNPSPCYRKSLIAPCTDRYLPRMKILA